jgi:hypothetical protein
MQQALGNEQRVQKISVFKPEGKRQHVSYKDTWKEEKMNSKEMIKIRVNFPLEQVMKAQRGSRDVSLLFT